MDIARLTEIAEWLEAGAPHRNGVTGFDMTNAALKDRNACGTSCCIAGAAVYFYNEELAENFEKIMLKELKDWGEDTATAPFYSFGSDGTGALDAGLELLGLDYQQANALFTPENFDLRPRYGDDATYRDITAEHAARVVRHLIATGEVDWTR